MLLVLLKGEGDDSAVPGVGELVHKLFDILQLHRPTEKIFAVGLDKKLKELLFTSLLDALLNQGVRRAEREFTSVGSSRVSFTNSTYILQIEIAKKNRLLELIML